MSEPVLRVSNLVVEFARRRSLGEAIRRRGSRTFRAVDGVTFTLDAGEVFALVGESGCGKTTTANAVLGLLRASGGNVFLGGRDVAALDKGTLRRMRRSMQMVFQDPYESLNPRMTVEEIVAEPLRVHRVPTDDEDEERRVEEALTRAGLNPPGVFRKRRPHELSGGQRQRVVIAGALALEPSLLVADEPVSMLDVSIRAEILNLLARLAAEQGIAILMITHDLSTVAAYSQRIAVMYLGRIVEMGPTQEVIVNPRHPYTEALLSVVPSHDPDRRTKPIILTGETPDPTTVPPGCRFHPRCPKAFDQCPQIDPHLYNAGPGHEAACLLVELARKGGS